MEHILDKSQTNESIYEDSIQNLTKLKVLSKKFINTKVPIILELCADLLALTFSFSLQYLLIFETTLVGNHSKQINLEVMFLVVFVLSIFWVILFYIFDLYKNWYERSPFDEIFSLLKVTIVGCFILYIPILFDSLKPPRMMILVYFLNFTISLIIFRTFARRLQHSLRKRKIIAQSTIIVGSIKNVKTLYDKISLSPSWGINPIGSIPLKTKKSINNEIPNLPKLGDFFQFNEILDNYKPELVIFATQKVNQSNLLDLVSLCDLKGIKVKIEPDLYHIFTGQTKTQNLYGIPLIEINPKLLKPWQEFTKRILDIFFSFFTLVLGLPIWVIIAIMIKIDSKGKIIYSQPRVGKNEKIFKIYKFRSMRSEPKKIEQLWTQQNDPRVTKLGRFLRKSHLDEVPQFWNVLKGDMSIVGPRPEQPKFVDEFSLKFKYYSRRHKIRPGITGWWQVKYRFYELNDEEIVNRLKDDFYYIENMNIKLDIEIILRTVWRVFRGYGQT